MIEKHGALQNAVEVAHLIEYLRRDPPKLIIEIGVWMGGNAALLKTYFPDARYIGVDMLTVDSVEVAPMLGENVAAFDLELVQGWSEPATVKKVKELIGDQKADYLFIDGAHDTDSVFRDFELWSPLARKVGFRDVHNPMVYKAWIEICGFFSDHARTAALWKETDGHGIGVVLT